MHNVSGRTSANTGVAPDWAMASAVAKNVNGAVMTSSPAPTPRARRAMVRPSVPLATPTAPLVPMYEAASSSKPLTLGPRMTRPLRSTSSTAPSMRSWSSAYCPLMSMSPTAMRLASLRDEVEARG